MPSNSQLMGKLARGESLDMGEVQQLERAMDGYDRLTNIVRNYTSLGGNQLNIPSAFSVIYSETLTVDTASLTIPIPSGYKHLMIMGSGRTTNAGTSSKFIYGRFNEDGNSNYAYEIIYAQGAATLDGLENTALNNGALVGILNDKDQTAGLAGTFFSIIPHYTGNFFKTCLANTGWAIASEYGLHVIHSLWKSTEKINTIRFIPASGSFATGSILSLYGIQ